MRLAQLMTRFLAVPSTRPRFPTGPLTVLDMPVDRPLAALEVQDQSQNSNHGTFGSGNTLTYPGLDFDGTGNSEIAPATVDVGDPQTFSCWFKPDGIGGNDMLFRLEGAADSIIVATGTLSVANLAGNGTVYVNGVAGTSIVAGIWQMCTVTIDAAESASSLLIGDSAGTQCNGIIAGVFISDKEFTAAEVLSLYMLTRYKYGV